MTSVFHLSVGFILEGCFLFLSFPYFWITKHQVEVSIENKPQKSNQTQNYIASPKHSFIYPYLDIGADEEVNKYMAIHHCVVKRVEAKSIRAQVVTTHPHSISVPSFVSRGSAPSF